MLLVQNGGLHQLLFRLQFYGAGPKLPGLPTQDKIEKTRGVKLNFEYDPLAKYMCQVIVILIGGFKSICALIGLNLSLL